MCRFSTEIKNIIQCLPIYKDIEVEYDSESNYMSKCCTPMKGQIENAKIVFRYNQTKLIYKMAFATDKETMDCIMKSIPQIDKISYEYSEIAYALFLVLHEAGHYYDYKSNPERYNKDFEGLESKEIENMSVEEYRNRPIEKRADAFAFEHFVESWNILNKSLFYNYLPKL